MDYMRCSKCTGRVFVDRTFSENKNYETFCINCGERKFISKGSVLGIWIHKMETARNVGLVRG